MTTNVPPEFLRSQKAENRGYVLVLTVVLLAMLTIAASFINQRVSLEKTQVWSELEEGRQERRVNSVRARTLWALATAVRSGRGLIVQGAGIQCDGRWYDAGNRVLVSIQDSRGLLNLVLMSREMLERYLATYALDAKKTGQLADALLDYQDEDMFERIQGAEAPQYKQLGLVPPRNVPLSQPSEAMRVLGWAEEAKLWASDGLLDNTYVWREPYINPNTATWRTLATAFSMSEQEARRLVTAREKDGLDLYQLLAQGMDPFVSIYSPSESRAFVVTIAVQGQSFAHREFIVFTPKATAGPWMSAYSGRVSIDRIALPATAPAFPGMVVKDETKEESRGLSVPGPLLPF